MWFKVFQFELEYRKARPATYIYFGVLFLMAFLAVSTDTIQIGGGVGLVKENAPVTIATMMGILTAVFMMITSAIMGVGVLRDFEHKMESMMFTTNLTKFDYLLGRYLGSLVVTVFAFSGILLGFVMGEFMPWRDAEKLLPFNFYNYFHPFLFIVLPNLFFAGTLFFVTGAISRKMVVVYTQWIVLFAIFQIALIITRDVDNRTLAALIDPFAIRTINNVTQYWTVAEQNSQTIPLTGVFLWNRLLWMGIGVIALILGYFNFSFNVVRSSLFKKKAVKRTETAQTDIAIPTPTLSYGLGSQLLQIWKQAKFYFAYVVKGIPFWAIFLFGFLLFAINSAYVGNVFGTYTYPTTYLMLNLFQGITLFFIIIIVFYSGELIWRERDVKFQLIQDALPVRDFTGLISKFLGLIMVFVVMLLFLIFSSVVIQAIKGYFKFDLGLYFSTIFSETFSLLILYTLLAFFIQVMVNNKFLGHAVMIIFFIAMGVLGTLGIEHSLFQFASASLPTYSEMNGYGHFFTRFNWFNFYWFAFAIFLFAVSVMFAVRGSEAAMKWRWKIGQLRLTRPLLIFGITAFLSFGLSGCFIYYNTNVLNAYQNSDDVEAIRADYERTLKKYQYIPQPKITSMDMKVELFPAQRDYTVEGTYEMKNFEKEPIQEIHIQLNGDEQFTHEYVKLSREATITAKYDSFNYFIHTLKEPLQPNETLSLDFKMVFESKGFVESGGNTSIVQNGTFINNSNFPILGYNEGYELGSDSDRKDNDLEPKERLMTRENPIGLGQNFFTDDSHGIDFEIVIGTAIDQIAVAPGYLQKEWEEDGRKYYHYKMDQQMVPFFNVVSARYESVKDKTTIPLTDSTTRDISLEIYYHKGHEYNLESMMKGMKDAFDYYSKNFTPYQFRQMRILEFPRYSNFAQSFANTVPFSEGIGFMLKIEEEDDVDAVYFVTAHELAHQWWGHQLVPANVQGGGTLSESLSQYSALMVMKKEYPQEHIKEFLKEELDRYLGGRTREQKKEMPLALVENQQYIHYGKGANIMYALQDYISEDSVNLALKRLVKKWRGNTKERNGRYATTKDLMLELRAVTPDSLQYILTDFYEKIILFENKVDEATFTELNENSYEVSLKLNTKKMEADSLGQETQIPMNYWIDVGVYGKDEQGEDKLLYLEKHYFDKDDTKLKIKVNSKPIKAGVDPLNKLIDRNPGDNIKSLTKKEES